MDEIKNVISRLRITAFLLFLIPTFALFGSIYIHNFLVAFDYKPSNKSNVDLNGNPGEYHELECNKNNNNCTSKTFKLKTNEKFKELDQCYKYNVKYNYVIDEILYDKTEVFDNIKNGILKDEFKNKKIYFRTYLVDQVNLGCVRTSEYFTEYKIAPFVFNYLYNLDKSKFSLGSSEKINPLIKGDTSISNIVKRYPLKFFFKPLLYISAFLMILYWSFYNKVFINYLNKDSNKFYYFGVASAIFLFLHVFFLGTDFEEEILNKIRRILIVFFIFFELSAQIFLAKDLFGKREELKKYMNSIIIYLKVYFVLIISIATIIILFALMFINFKSNVDYILEWNYFLILLIFYFLSSIIWKKLV